MTVHAPDILAKDAHLRAALREMDRVLVAYSGGVDSAVAAVLMLGLYNMLRGGSPNVSQKLMRWRVVLQFIAIIIIMLTVWAMGR